MNGKIIQGDCLEVMRRLPEGSVDLSFFSPPYEDARTYGIDFNLKGQEYVDWLVKVFEQAVRITKGLTACVIQGRTRQYKWSCTPALLIADLHRAGFNVRNPLIYQRSGIPGSGGPDWLRSDYEWIVCVSRPGRLPWSDNTACGDEPKYKPGGAPTHRLQNGKRVRVAAGKGKAIKKGTNRGGNKLCKQDQVGAEIVEEQPYIPPKIANPGNIIKCSGGHLGSKLAGSNEAPFPEKLADFMIHSFCPPDGTVMDIFGGSGTVAAVAEKTGRKWISIDVRKSQCDLTLRRINEEIGNETKN